MTIKELITLLQTFPEETRVGRVGHFGEFHEMDKYDFHLSKVYVTKHRVLQESGEKVLNIEPPYIGEQPE